jgi:hypothetical protein
MSAKAGTKKQQKESTTVVAVPEKAVIEEKAPEKEVILKETEVSSAVVENISSLEKEDSDEEDKNSVINEDEGLISSTEYINFVNKQIENTKNLTNALKSIQYFTKSELKEVDKVKKLLHKAESLYAIAQSKVFFSLAANSAPKAKKEIKLDSNGNKIPSEGKNPVVWEDFAKDAFKLESNNGFGSKYLQHVWELIKSESGTKNGASIIISNPGATNTFFQNIKRVMEERGLKTEKEIEVHALIEKGVLANTDITKFSKYCYEEKEKKPKATKKSKAV